VTREQWRPVAGYEDAYEVSDRGRVRSIDRIVAYIDGSRRKHRGRVLVVSVDTQGRNLVQLYSNGARRHVEVSALVAEAFNPAKKAVAWSKGDRTLISCIDDAVKLLTTAEQAVAWYRAQLAAMTLANEQLKAELAKTKPALSVAA
jgi:NUMOD4 motif-containing protein